MKLTQQMIFAGKSAKGAWTAAQLRELGIAWPPRSGWIRRLTGTEIHGDRYARFLALTKQPSDGTRQLLLKDIASDYWDDSPERFANALYEQSYRNLA